MDHQTWQRAKPILAAALECTPEERQAFIESHCADEDLLRVIRELLATELTPAHATLAPGTRLGPHVILESIGAGGMGEVYHGRDTNLGRDVAIKLLPERFAADRARVSRLRREALLLASLAHPNIAALYSSEDVPAPGRHAPVPALVMEFVDGETITEHLTRGPVPLREALRIASHLADALEAAHDKGIVHRDVKPSNIKIRTDGTVKVLDFGLAKLVDRIDGEEQVPQLWAGAPISRADVILGTPAYMSPEQARGLTVDRRTDIWAFGCVLFEMLAGTKPFARATVSAADAWSAVLTADPDWPALPPATPRSVRRLLDRCLDKDPRRRLQAIGEARIAIDDVLQEQSVADSAFNAPRRHRIRYGPIALGVLAASVLAVQSLSWWLGRADDEPQVARYVTTLPDMARPARLTLSPNGRTVAYLATPQSSLYIRRLDQLAPTALDHTEGARFPFFFADERWIGYYKAGSLWKVSATGGLPVKLADVDSTPPFGGAAAAPDGSLAFATMSGLWQLRGTSVEALSAPPATQAERVVYRAPEFLPDGKSLLVTIEQEGGESHIAVFDTVTRQYTRLVQGEVGRYVPGPSRDGGHLVFARGTTLYASALDVTRQHLLTAPTPIADEVAFENGRAAFTVSHSGTLMYVSGSRAEENTSNLVWVERDGTVAPVGIEPHRFVSVRLSPGGERLAVQFSTSGGNRVGVYDLARETLTTLTFDGNNVNPIWSADGRSIAFRSNRPGPEDITVMVAADGSGTRRILARDSIGGIANSWSRDGRLLVGWGSSSLSPMPFTLWSIALASDRAEPSADAVRSLLSSPFARSQPVLSPDERWLAYASSESGRSEIYVQPFPQMNRRWQISTNGGSAPRWRADGRELLFRSDGAVMSAAIDPTAEFRASLPRLLIEGDFAAGYDVAPDGQRFVMIKPPQRLPEVDQVHVVINWSEELRRQVPTDK